MNCESLVRECWNCNYDWAGSCEESEHDLKGVSTSPQSGREAACRAYLEDQSSVMSTVYRWDEDKCYYYDCSSSVTYKAGYKAFVKTCTAECLNAAMYFHPGQRLTGSSPTASVSSLEACTLKLTATSQSGAVSYSGNGATECVTTTACSTDCPLQTASAPEFDLVVFDCSGTTTAQAPTTTSTTITTSLASTSPATTPTTESLATTASVTSTSPAITPTTEPLATTASTTSVQNAIETTFVQAPLARLYIMPCICYTGQEWTNLSQSEIINILVKNLTINTKETSLNRYRYKCRPDSRESSANIGRFATAVMIVIVGVVVLADLGTCCKGRCLKKSVKMKRTRKVIPATLE
ncbi:uncharacterized protein LOC128245907 [Mya arenaria]|uniref:uncharacterized protein LOC128245907 n=1 Tax=Mya arenaria TaxID=6604 RepID=UPI0022E645D2|nr:uncharacterized protein LOC128245907 [Mya arenaria]